jgi:hypothetical protein
MRSPHAPILEGRPMTAPVLLTKPAPQERPALRRIAEAVR